MFLFQYCQFQNESEWKEQKMPQQKLSNEEQILSLDQVKQFILEHGDNDRYNGKCTVYVNQYGVEEVYQIEVSISFDGLGYQVAFSWDDDESYPDYRELGLYGVYSSCYNMFKYNKSGTLNLKNNDKSITIQVL